MSVHVGSRLIFFLSVVGNFFRVLSVVSSIFRPLSLFGQPHSHPLYVDCGSWKMLASLEFHFVSRPRCGEDSAMFL